MKIIFSPVRSDDSLALSKSGSALTINGEAFDFSRMSEGDVLPARAILSPWFLADVEHTAGGLVITLRLPIPANYSQEQAFPEPLLDVQDGVVPMPQPLPEPTPSMEIPNEH